MYVPTFGLLPNSAYMPAPFLNAAGSIMVDAFLQVKGAQDVWAIGDVTDVESWQFITTDRQSTHLAKNMIALMNGKAMLPYKVSASRMCFSPYRCGVGMYANRGAGFMGLQIGKKAGTGHFGNFKIPSFVIVRARKTLFVENMVPTVNGALF